MKQDQVKDVINQAINIPIWQAKKGIGSFLTFDMGDRTVVTKKNGTTYDKGSIHLWIYLCDWEIRSEGHILAKSDSPDNDITNAVKCFTGERLLAIEKVTSNRIEIKASKNLVITLAGNNEKYKDEDDFFILYVPGFSVSYSKKLGFYVEL